MKYLNLIKLYISIMFIKNILSNFPRIKNYNGILCKNCIYYKSENYVSNKCIKFGELDLVSGKIEYDYAYKCRVDSNCCGLEAKYFQERKNKTKIENIIKQYD